MQASEVINALDEFLDRLDDNAASVEDILAAMELCRKHANDPKCVPRIRDVFRAIDDSTDGALTAKWEYELGIN